MKNVALYLIELYQRYVSPRKGFCCAYRVHTGQASCSVLGYRVIRRFGVWAGVALLRQRLAKCGVAYRRHHVQPVLGPRHRQAGFCDASCDVPCDFDFDFSDGICDMASSCGGSSSKGKRYDEDSTYLPPHSRHSRHHEAPPD